ncbi:MAG: YitT family protein [Christensenellales bacterium]|jgi:uncharacterized membrane-anchored protein YitT (DUF2179 family)
MNKIFETKKQFIASALTCIAGAAIMSFSIILFLAPMKIPVGGFTGIATVLSTSGIIKLSIGALTLIMNIPLFLFSYRHLGSRFGVLSIISTLVFTISMDVFSNIKAFQNFSAQMTDMALSAVYGATIHGIGLGLIIRAGGSTGGSDMLANVIGRKFHTHNIGYIIFIIDFIVILMSGLVFKSYILPLYAFLTTFLTSKVIDYLIEGGKRTKVYYIFSEKIEEISAAILADLKRGVTAFKGTGMYTRKERNMIVCLINRTQTNSLKKLVKNIDKNAFIFAVNAHEAFGEGFTPIVDNKQKS